MKSTTIISLVFLYLLLAEANGGIIAYGMCQSVCNIQAVWCYTGAGFVFGTVIAAPSM